MPRIVVNRCFGGFGISRKAAERLVELGVPESQQGKKDPDFWEYWVTQDLKRTDPRLIQVVEELGEEANGMCAKLDIVEIPDGVDWEIHDYDGMETVRERSRSW
jgi:hypothetical protein